MWYSLKVYFFITEWTLSPLFCDVHQTNDVKFNTVNCHTQTPTNYTVFFLHITHIAHHLGAGRVNCLAHSFVFWHFRLIIVANTLKCAMLNYLHLPFLQAIIFFYQHYLLHFFTFWSKLEGKKFISKTIFLVNRMHWFHQIPCGNSNPKKPNLQFAVELNYHLSWYLVISSN